MTYQHHGRSFSLLRYPPTKDRSLRPISAADELLLASEQLLFGRDQVAVENFVSKGLVVQHDRFGVLATILCEHRPQFVSSFASQKMALQQQLAKNALEQDLVQMRNPLEELAPTDLGLLRIPKSLELFELYLAQFARMANRKETPSVLLAGFMTRHFTANLLKIAERYAQDVSQSKARKKARVLRMTDFRKDRPRPEDLIKSINFNGDEYQQYYGVFSANHVDYATQFLLEYLKDNPSIIHEGDGKLSVLDLACGNGVIGRELLKQRKGQLQLTAIDDFYLATLSAQMNLTDYDATVSWSDGLSEFGNDRFDLVVSNPPFHFGYETNIEVSLKLFAQVARTLRENGKLILVGNRHLNYSTHLRHLYGEVRQLAENDKFEILGAKEPLNR